MRVFSQINNCQQKQKKQNKTKKQKQKTGKTKRGAPLLGLAKSIYYHYLIMSDFWFSDSFQQNPASLPKESVLETN